MAATIARATGSDRTRNKSTHRLGSERAWTQAATWKTFATVEVDKDGSGNFVLMRNGKLLIKWEWGPEEGASVWDPLGRDQR